MQVCPSCGEENPDRFRLCGICGAVLAPGLPTQEVRKTVTILFCDLKGSTSLGEQMDTESLREVLDRYFTEMKAAIERHGGRVEKFIGDAVVAVFGLPRVHEDDALRAVRAAVEMGEALERVNGQLELVYGIRLANRTGVNTGEVVAGEVTAGQALVTGDTANVAARLEQAAAEREILIGRPTYELVRDAVDVEPVDPLSLKGKAEPVPAYRLLAVRQQDSGIARRLDAPLVGRDRELGVLEEALDRAIAGRRCELVTVVAAAGVGKSRLLQEFLLRSGGRALKLRGRCLSYGEGITFWPLAEVIRAATGIENDDPLDEARRKVEAVTGPDVAARLAGAIGLSTESYPVREVFWAARRFLEAASRRRPLIVVIEDIHWAERTFLDLLHHVVGSVEDAPIVISCSSRPELLEEQAGWTDAGRTIELAPLSEEDSGRVIQNLLGATDVDGEARARIIAGAEGNPLFVEQLLSMLVEQGSLRADESGRWVLASPAEELAIPPTISALLAARLDRLGSQDRLVIERAAVIGQVFFRGALEALLPEHARTDLGESLTSLVGKEMIRPHEATLAGEQAYGFAHVLIRDAAYRGVLKRARAELHEGFVDWLESVTSDRVMEYAEIRGYHLEQAYLTRAELAPVDQHGEELGRRAAAYLSAAGRRALAAGDMPAAANLLERAAALLPDEDPMRLRILPALGEALTDAGEFARAEAVLDGAVGAAERTGERTVAADAALERLMVRLLTDSGGGLDELVRDVQGIIPTLEELGFEAGLAKAWRLLGSARGTASRYGEAEDAMRLAIEHARRAGDRRLEVGCLSTFAQCALYGPTPVAEAIPRCESILEQTVGDQRAEATILCALSHLDAMAGDFERARSRYSKARATLEGLGGRVLAASTSLDSGPVELLAGDLAAAERELLHDYEVLEAMGERYFISTTAALLAEALYRQDRLEESERFTVASQELADPEDLTSQHLWRSVRGKVLARRSRTDEAETLLREAVELTRRSDDPDARGSALLDLAEAMVLIGRDAEAEEAATEAALLFEGKGNVVSARHARGFQRRGARA